MVAIAGNITESLDITDWRVSAYTCSDGALAATDVVTGATYSLTVPTVEPHNVIIAPKIDYKWSTSKEVNIGDYVIPSNPDTTPHLFKCTESLGGDPDYDYTSLQLHFDNNYTDVSKTPKTVTANGAVALSSTWSKFGGYSAYFPGSTADYLSVPDHDDLDLSDDFLIRFWYKPTNVTGQRTVISKTSPGSFGPYMVFQNSTSLLFYSASGVSSWDIASGLTIGTVTADTEYYVEITRVSGVFYTFLNGVLGGTLSNATLLPVSIYNLIIGKWGEGSNYPFAGYIDDLEIKKIGGHTSGYTPPTAEFISGIGALSGATEPTWNLSGTTVEGDITYTYVAPLVDPVIIGPKIPS